MFKRPERKRLTRLRLSPLAIRERADRAQRVIEDYAGKPRTPEQEALFIMAACVIDLAEDLRAARADRERLDLVGAKAENVLHDLYYALYPPEE